MDPVAVVGIAVGVVVVLLIGAAAVAIRRLPRGRHRRLVVGAFIDLSDDRRDDVPDD